MELKALILLLQKIGVTGNIFFRKKYDCLCICVFVKPKYCRVYCRFCI